MNWDEFYEKEHGQDYETIKSPSDGRDNLRTTQTKTKGELI